jgi:hypothetical protein
MKISVRLHSLMFLGLAWMMWNVPAGAQQWAVYGMGTGANLRVPSSNYLYGGSLGLYRQNAGTPKVAWGPDFRVSLMVHGDVTGQFTDERLDLGTVGARVVGLPGAKLRPYGEALLGFGYWRAGEGLTRQDKYTGVLQALVGVDYTIKPRIDWRVAEIGYARLNGQSYYINPLTFSTGIVLRVP